MATYEMQEMNLPNDEGKRILYPRMKLAGQDDLEEIARRISRATTFTQCGHWPKKWRGAWPTDAR